MKERGSRTPGVISVCFCLEGKTDIQNEGREDPGLQDQFPSYLYQEIVRKLTGWMIQDSRSTFLICFWLRNCKGHEGGMVQDSRNKFLNCKGNEGARIQDSRSNFLMIFMKQFQWQLRGEDPGTNNSNKMQRHCSDKAKLDQAPTTKCSGIAVTEQNENN